MQIFLINIILITRLNVQNYCITFSKSLVRTREFPRKPIFARMQRSEKKQSGGNTNCGITAAKMK